MCLSLFKSNCLEGVFIYAIVKQTYSFLCVNPSQIGRHIVWVTYSYTGVTGPDYNCMVNLFIQMCNWSGLNYILNLINHRCKQMKEITQEKNKVRVMIKE